MQGFAGTAAVVADEQFVPPLSDEIQWAAACRSLSSSGCRDCKTSFASSINAQKSLLAGAAMGPGCFSLTTIHSLQGGTERRNISDLLT